MKVISSRWQFELETYKEKIQNRLYFVETMQTSSFSLHAVWNGNHIKYFGKSASLLEC